MLTTYLNAKDWSDFEERFPAAAAFLATRSVKREFEWLQHNEDLLTAQQLARLKDLRSFFPPSTHCKYAREDVPLFKELLGQPMECTHPDRVQAMMCHRQNCPWTERQQNDNCWED